MKINKLLYILLFSLLVIPACDKSEFEIKEVEGGLVDLLNLSTNYVVGNSGPYTSSLKVYQGTVKTNKVEVYKSFHTMVPAPTEEDSTAMEAAVSNEVLFKTFDISNTDEGSTISFDYYLNDLIEGLTVNDNSLPTNDAEYQIGDYWEFRVVSYTDDSRSVVQNKTAKTTVATRFAGKYRPISCAYGRYTGTVEWFYFTSDWPSETIIESVDAITYKVLEYFGPFDGNEWYFQVDPATLKITYPAEWNGVAQTGNDQPFITCETNPADFAIMAADRPEDIHCDDTDYVILDDVNGKDRLEMTFGYYTAGSGPRVFHQLLEKIVE
ncbi:hypothetical protein ACE01N_12230 [Saccharicrinis sp. FJH2]|uniref:hypothetical protein n=1 Tax=Saccharicrinis sp. FJH65 TaxID=3344659 RepID=UPI0035F37AE4